ncbi:class I SAM-dependent methyltransferase [candidate division WOR-3 bacterium]|nr:class I SAM-dependent methyltransferase [candidate division WOR-3 bacterium]
MELQELKKDIVFEDKLRGFNLVFRSTWGLFSPKNIDEGTRLLIDQLEVNETDTCLDIGCGYGAIGLVMAKLAPKGKVYLIDKDFVAIKYAQKNIKLNGVQNCEVSLSNVFNNLSHTKFNVIASNLPAKVGKELLYIIMTESRRRLKKEGKFYVVTISGLKEYIKREFKNVFGNYKKLRQGKRYTVALAIK